MKLIIDIPDWYYHEVQEFKHPDFVDKAIMDGIILPKGHGRLKDVDKIISDGIDKGFCNWYDEMKYAPTIIEADKETK